MAARSATAYVGLDQHLVFYGTGITWSAYDEVRFSVDQLSLTKVTTDAAQAVVENAGADLRVKLAVADLPALATFKTPREVLFQIHERSTGDTEWRPVIAPVVLHLRRKA